MSRLGILRCTRDVIETLDRHNEVWEISDPVDPNLELAQIQREVCRRKGPALLFTNVIGTPFPVATNMYGTPKRLDIIFGDLGPGFIKEAAKTAMEILPPTKGKLWGARKLARQALKIGLKSQKKGEVLRNKIEPADLSILPQIKSWPDDGGAFITFPLVYTESLSSGKGNLGMYRIQLFNKTEAGMHIQIHRGGGYHYYEAERKNVPLPVRVMVGGPPALTISAVAPLPEDIPELIFASLLMGEKLKIGRPDELGTRLAFDADFSIQGKIQPNIRKPEGPFGDHFGYYSQQHDYPYFVAESIYHRDNAIFPATVVGIPPQEDHYISNFLQDMMSPLYPLLMPNVSKIWAYGESGVHALTGAIVKERYPKEAFGAALRILGEGQLSLTKVLMVTDDACDIKDFRTFLVKVLERMDLRSDLFVFSNISQDTLDYTGPKVNEGSKAIFLGVGAKKRDLKQQWNSHIKNNNFSDPTVFCPGVICFSGIPYGQKKDLAEDLLNEPGISDFTLAIILDDAKSACESTSSFLWQVFTRFEPAADIYGKSELNRFHLSFEGPLVIDCRMKPWYPSVLEEQAEVVQRVKDKWGAEIDQRCRLG